MSLTTYAVAPTEIYPNIYYFANPLPNNPLRELNVYLIRDGEESLLIDTGFNRPECKRALLDGLKALDIDLSKMSLFITHLHADHSGLAGLFKESAPKIYASRIDGEIMNSIPRGGFEIEANKRIQLLDLVKDSLEFKDLPGHAYAYKEVLEFDYLEEGDTLTIGDYTFHVIEVAGHTPGMLTLYEPTEKIYFSADHLLDQISPNITFWDFEFDALAHYLKNLAKVVPLPIKEIFPAHRNRMNDHPRRALEIIEHHHQRLEEVYEIMTDKPQSVQIIASQMEWRIRANSWAEFPLVQKYFASGEAMAHLEYLYNNGRIARDIVDGVAYYQLLEWVD